MQAANAFRPTDFGSTALPGLFAQTEPLPPVSEVFQPPTWGEREFIVTVRPLGECYVDGELVQTTEYRVTARSAHDARQQVVRAVQQVADLLATITVSLA